jgi:hypothetical protein
MQRVKPYAGELNWHPKMAAPVTWPVGTRGALRAELLRIEARLWEMQTWQEVPVEALLELHGEITLVLIADQNQGEEEANTLARAVAVASGCNGKRAAGSRRPRGPGKPQGALSGPGGHNNHVPLP